MPTLNPPEPTAVQAVIGGSGLYSLGLGNVATTHRVDTPYSAEPVEITEEIVEGRRVLFLPRHGKRHTLAPHQINYRANVWALQKAGASSIIAVNAVGGITVGMTAGRLVIPNQLIDYTWGREHTFCTGEHSLERHVDFT